MSVMSPGRVLWNVAGRCPAMMAAAVGSNARDLALTAERQVSLATHTVVWVCKAHSGVHPQMLQVWQGCTARQCPALAMVWQGASCSSVQCHDAGGVRAVV